MNPLTPEQRAVFAGHKWAPLMNLDSDDGGRAISECAALDATKATFTPKAKGRYGTPVVTYHLAGDETEFTNLADLADAILKRRAAKAAAGGEPITEASS